MTQSFVELPTDFRAETVNTLMQHILAGDSCMLIGIGSVGKSNLMRFLQRKDVQRERLDASGRKFLFVYLDKNKLLELSPWGLMELMIYQIWMGLSNVSADSAVLQRLEELHTRSGEVINRGLVLRYLERTIHLVCVQLDWHIVFLLDDFDALYNALPAHSLAALRALRDEYKYRLIYITAANTQLNSLREAASKGEPFEELLVSKIVWLGPYGEKDAELVMQRLQNRYQTMLNAKDSKELIVAAGGHPGLLRVLFSLYMQGIRDFSHWIDDERLLLECHLIWRSLTGDDQRLLSDLARTGKRQGVDKNLNQLRFKKVLSGPWSTVNGFFSSIFENYVLEKTPPIGAHFILDVKQRIILKDEIAIKGLTPLEYRFLEFLVMNRNKSCSRNELIEHMYPSDQSRGDAISDDALDATVKRVRKKVEPIPDDPRFIITIRGYGFKLDDGEEAEFQDKSR